MTLPFDRAYPRDLVGYGQHRPAQVWPNEARLALQFVVNYEEGGERSILDGDAESESLLSDLVGAVPLRGRRHMNIESSYEYGSRAGFWRLLRLFRERNLPVTCNAVGLALEKNPAAALAMREAGWEVASHGYRWLDYRTVSIETERAHIRQTVEIIRRLVGDRPVGHYQDQPSANTRGLIAEEGGFLYDSQSVADDLPYWTTEREKPYLIVPYALDTSDIRFLEPPCIATGGAFFGFLRDAFDQLLQEGRQAPRMMSVGLHGRISGRPGRAAGLARFLDYVSSVDGIWICRRRDIAAHWHQSHRI